MSRVPSRLPITLCFLILTSVFISLFSGVVRMPSGEARSAAPVVSPFQNPPQPVLNDDFNDNVLDTEMWREGLLNEISDMYVTVAETAQHLEIAPQVNRSASYSGISTNGGYS